MRRTVNGNGHALAQDVAISSLEGGNLAELVDLEVIGRNTLGWLSVDNLEVELIRLCDGQKGRTAWVALKLC